MFLYNTLTQKIEKFSPLHSSMVNLYTCGPTVYDYVHIGNLRTYINNDVLKRVLLYNNYKVKHVMNITDVGHLTDDADAGEDKLEKGAKKQNKTVWDVARFFTNYFFYATDQLNIFRPDIVCRATDHVRDMIKMIQVLEKEGFTYETKDAIYFDTRKFISYGVLNRQKNEEKKTGARKEVVTDPKKKSQVDFALWFKRVGRFSNHTMHWNSPWGDGFPGWHIECSAMSMKYLGETIDIHAGGVDHIPIHHENEIAQSEVATGKQFVRYWFHSEFLTIEGKKMSKSFNNFYTIDDIKKKNIDPLALRYLFLQTHYRTQMNFTWEAAYAAAEGYKKMREIFMALKKQTRRQILSPEKLNHLDDYRNRFIQTINDDLQTPQAITIMWEVFKSNIPSIDKYDLILEFDRVFGLGLDSIMEIKFPAEIIKLAEKRKNARQKKDFIVSDEIRKKIKAAGYIIEDKNNDYFIKKIT